MNNKSVSTATIGYMCYALSFWMIGVFVTGWASGSDASIWAIAFPLAVLLLVIGILACVHGRTLDAIIFFGGFGVLWSAHSLLGLAGHAAPSEGYLGWFFIVWTVFFAWVFLGALKAGIVRTLFLLALWLAFLAEAISAWGHVHVIDIVGGYLYLATGVLAAIVSASEIICHGRSGHLNESSAA